MMTSLLQALQTGEQASHMTLIWSTSPDTCTSYHACVYHSLSHTAFPEAPLIGMSVLNPATGDLLV